MARKSKQADAIRSLKALARKRGYTISQPTADPSDSSSTAFERPPPRGSFPPPTDLVDSVDAEMLEEWANGVQAARRFWTIGQYQMAAALFRAALNLDVDQPRFVHYWLASCLFQLELSDDLDVLLEEYEDDTDGIWRFAQALHAFRQYGDTDDARRFLVEANHLEPGFQQYLLQDKTVDALREVRFDGSPAERAFGCARLFLPAWRGVPGAAAWARRVLKVPQVGDHDALPRRFPRDELRALPLRQGETWHVGMVPYRDQSQTDAAPLWLFGVVNVEGHEMRAVTVIDRQLTDTVAWNELLPSLLSPLDGMPVRPGDLVVCRHDLCESWTPLLAEIGIRCRYEDLSEPVSQLLQGMGAVLDQQKLPQAAGIDIRQFPQTGAVWQADFIRSPVWVMNDREGAYRPWSVLVLEKSRSKALTTSNTPGEPTPELLLELLVRTMANPGGGSAKRPQLIEVADSDCYDYLQPRLEAAGIACQLVDEMREFNDFCLRLARSCDRSEKCALADGQGVTRAHMESFYEAADAYFRQAPWLRVPGEAPIEIRCDNPAMGTRYAIVLGRTGLQMGLCIYDNWEVTLSILRGYASAEDMRGLTVCYDEPQIMAAVDLQLIERLGWPIATPEAWPATMRLAPRRTPRSPNAEEVVFLDACLRAIPDFLQSRGRIQSYKADIGARSVELRLAWKR